MAFNISVVVSSRSSGSQRGLVWDVVVSSFSLLFLKLDGDASHWALLDSLHGVRDETGDLVLQVLGWHNGDLIDDSRVGVKVKTKFGVVLLDDSSAGLLDGLGSHSSHFWMFFGCFL